MTQLTITLDDNIAEKARQLAAKSGTTVDVVIAELLEAGTALEAWKSQLPPITRSLLGIAPPMSDEEVDRTVEDALRERYERQ